MSSFYFLVSRSEYVTRGWRTRLERGHPCLQRRGFRGVTQYRDPRDARSFSCFALMQARMPAVQSVDDIYGNSCIEIMC